MLLFPKGGEVEVERREREGDVARELNVGPSSRPRAPGGREEGETRGG